MGPAKPTKVGKANQIRNSPGNLVNARIQMVHRKVRSNIKTLIKASQRKTVTVNKGGRPRKLTINEVGLHGLEQEVLRGSRSAFLIYLELQDRYQDRDELRTSMQSLRPRTSSSPTCSHAKGKFKRMENKDEFAF